MERLTERFSNGQAAVAGCGNNCKYEFKYCEDNFAGNCPTLIEIYEKLANYEDLEEQGRLIVLPCKIGDTVYIIGSKYRRGYFENYINTGKFDITDLTKLGNSVFITKAEAEKALEMEK